MTMMMVGIGRSDGAPQHLVSGSDGGSISKPPSSRRFSPFDGGIGQVTAGCGVILAASKRRRGRRVLAGLTARSGKVRRRAKLLQMHD
jgi:hypothetical protein